MKMQFFQIPTHDANGADGLNRFLAGRRILSVDRHFVADGANSFWAIAVMWLPGAESTDTGKKETRVDDKQVLSEADFRVFAQLRDVRKSLADSLKVPAYAVFSNQQLASLVLKRVVNLTQMQTIEGVGKARCRDYGEPMLADLREHFDASHETDEHGDPT